MLGERKAIARKTFRLLVLRVIDDGKMNGYEIMKSMKELFSGEYSPSPGLVYPTLRSLEREGLLSSESIGGSRYYSLTEKGKRILEERKGEIDQLIERMRELKRGEHEELKKAVERLMRSLYVYLPELKGDKEKRVVEILEEARRKIITIFEGDEDG
ncbi:MAG: PadR family transcriptional regulator [Fervidicoccaceae archaeon]|jgi:DNA-binding PadR family transcriptional regulator